MAIYRIILTILAPFIVLAMLLRPLVGRDSWSGTAERFGQIKSLPNGAPVIWVHGASLGEMTAARPLMEQLIAEIDSLHIVATMNTTTAYNLVSGWNNPAITAQMSPLDYSVIIARFCRKMQPKVIVTLENELWPNRLVYCQKHGVPVFVVGGRMSARSSARWAKLKTLSSNVMAAISYLAPIDEKNGTRFLKLGLIPDRLGKPVNLKVSVELPDTDHDLSTKMGKYFPYPHTFLAASTHEGDEEMILAAFSEAHRSNPEIRLILAPRHPHRGAAVAQLIEKQGLSYGRRSLDQEPKINDSVFLADTVGEMSTWYSLATTTIIGGTFSNRGGHTPVEPIQFGSLVIHGDDVANHSEAFAALSANNAAITLKNPANLPEAFGNTGENRETDEMKVRAEQTVAKLREQQSDTSDVIAAIKATV